MIKLNLKRVEIIIYSIFIGIVVYAFWEIVINRPNAARKAEADFQSLGINLEFQVPEQITSEQELAATLTDLAVWSCDTRERLNEEFQLKEPEYGDLADYVPPVYDANSSARAAIWKRSHLSVNQNVQESIGEIFELAKLVEASLFSEDDYQAAFADKGILREIADSTTASEYKKEANQFYRLAGWFNPESDYEWIVMDLAYSRDPEGMTEACNAFLTAFMEDSDYDYEYERVKFARKFGSRYRTKLPKMSAALRLMNSRQYEALPDVPYVGMSLSSVSETKLGAYTSQTTKHDSWSHKYHTYGDLEWKKNGKMVFTAHYFDGVIKEVKDYRNSKPYKPSKPSGSSSTSGSSTVDPDDHDIEAYYEDHRDEYDDEDDAYEGFLEDEDSWDDY